MSRISRLFPAKPRQRAGLWLLAALATIAMLTGVVARTGAGRDMPMIARLDDALAALIARSPGERAAGAVGKTRRAAASGDESSPAVERALGKIFPAQSPELALIGGPMTVPIDNALMSTPPIGNDLGLPLSALRSPGLGGSSRGFPPTGTFLPIGGGNGGGALPGGGGSAPSGGAGTIPSGGGGTFPPGGGGGASPPGGGGAYPVGVVPEPGTWALVTLGIGLVAAPIRRARRRRRLASV